MVRKLTALLFLLLLAAGCATLLWRLAANAPALGRQLATAGWTDGAVTAALDHEVGLSMPSSAALDAALHGLLYAATGDADPQVRQGCPGWLFLSEETASTPQGERNLQQRLRLAGLLRAALAQRGIVLVSVPVPDKVEQARSQLCGLAVSAQAAGRRQAWWAGTALTAPTAPTAATAPTAPTTPTAPQVDLHAGWPAPGYWRTDTHWDRAGASFAAGRVAASVLTIIAPGNTGMDQHIAATAQVRSGDLARLAKLDGNAPPFGPPPEFDRAHTLAIARGGSLLDDVAAPQVLLAGSSYSLNSGFQDALQLALRQEVSQQSRTGSGFAGSLLDLLAQPQRLADVKVVVGEWPLRVLYQPLTAPERAFLQQADVVKIK